MKKPILAAMFLMLTPVISQAAQDSGYDTSPMERSSPGATNPNMDTNPNRERSNSDNTEINKRDRNTQSLTPLDQSNTQADTKIIQSLRQSLMKNDFSTDAKNIKIISQNGEVTLRGSVNNRAEVEKIAALAKAVPGIKTLNNQLEVK